MVHRLVLEAFVGSCPKDYQSRHLDGNPGNPERTNLCWGTRKENMADKTIHGTTPNFKGSKNPYSKLSEIDVLEIKDKIAKGEKQTDLAKEYNTSDPVISSIKHNKAWKHLWK